MDRAALHVLIVAEHRAVRHEVRRLLERASPGARVTEASGDDDLGAACRSARPDCVLLAGRPGELDRLAALGAAGDAPVILLAGEGPAPAAEAAWRGARGCLPLEGLTPERLARGIAGALAARSRPAALTPQGDEQRFRLALEAAQVVAWEWDIGAGTVTYASHAGGGLPPPCQLTSSVEDMLATLYPPDLPAYRQAVAAAIERGEPFQLQVRVRGAGGQLRWVEIRGIVQPDAGGRPARLVGVNRDIGDLKRREMAQALHVAISRALGPDLDVEATLAALARLPLPALADACAVYLPGDDGAARPAAAFRWDGGRPEPVAPGQGAAAPGLPDEVLRSGLARVVAGPAPGLAPGLEPLALRSALIVPLAAQGSLLGALLLGLVTGERCYDGDDLALAEALARRGAEALVHAGLRAAARAAELAAAAAHARLDALVASAPIGIGYLDRELRYVLANPALAAINGLPPGDHIGRRMDEVLPAIAPQIEPVLRRVLETGEAAREIELKGGPGAPGAGDWLVSYFPIPGPAEQVAGVGVTITDITQSRRAEELVRAALAAEQAARLAAERAAERTSRLQAVTAGLAGALSQGDVIGVIADHGVVATGASAGMIALLDAAGEQLEIISWVGQDTERSEGFRALPMSAAAAAPAALDSGEPVWLPSREEAEARFPGATAVMEHFDAHALATLPLLAAGRALGTMSFSYAAPNPFPPEDRTFLMALAQQCAQALERVRLYGELLASQARLQQLSQRLLDAQEQERRHLARELHDEVGQALTGLRLTLELAGRLPPEARAARLAEAHHATQELITRVRSLSLDLRPAMLDDMGLLPALLWQLKRYREQTGIAVELRHWGLGGRLPGAVETVAYRVVQEALTNVARHAGVDTAEVSLLATGGRLLVQVRDGGLGFELPAALAGGASSGLTGMHERAALLGGSLSVETAPGAGTCVTVELPLDEEAGL